MDFDWSLYLGKDLTLDEVTESFEDPFSIRLLPDAARFATQIRYFSLGGTSSGKKIFAVYTSTGKVVKVVTAREMTEPERHFYERKSQQL